MSKTTYPVFGEMLPSTDDMQLIVDCFSEEDRKRLTLDGIFNPGIVNNIDNYLQKGSGKNTLKIIPFVAYTKSGNRIEVANTYDFLSPDNNGNIPVNEDVNRINKEKNIPYWYHYSQNYLNFVNVSQNTYSLLITNLKPGSILQGIKIKHTQSFRGAGEVKVSIGPGVYSDFKNKIWNINEPQKFTPEFIISTQPSADDIETSNLLYCESGTEYVPIVATFTCSEGILNNLTSGNLQISLCITDVSNVTYDELDTNDDGLPLTNAIGYWEPNITYFIVARYTNTYDELTSINITDDDIDLQTKEFYSRKIDSFKFKALRRTGPVIDYLTNDDIKLGKVISDNQGNIAIYVNEWDEGFKSYNTDYLTLPSIRFKEFSDTIIKQLEDSKVSKSGDTLSGNLEFENNIGLVFKGTSEYNIKEVENGNLQLFDNNNRGLYLKQEENKRPFYFDGLTDYKILTDGDSIILNSFVDTYLNNKDVIKETYTGADGSWYRLYQSGWVEQGGRENVANDGIANVVFLKPFNNSNYYVNWISCSGATYGGSGTRAADELKPTGFRIFNGQDVRMTANWFACGYSNEAQPEDEEKE